VGEAAGRAQYGTSWATALAMHRTLRQQAHKPLRPHSHPQQCLQRHPEAFEISVLVDALIVLQVAQKDRAWRAVAAAQWRIRLRLEAGITVCKRCKKGADRLPCVKKGATHAYVSSTLMQSGFAYKNAQPQRRTDVGIDVEQQPKESTDVPEGGQGHNKCSKEGADALHDSIRGWRYPVGKASCAACTVLSVQQDEGSHF
jgi:hypothetical protein